KTNCIVIFLNQLREKVGVMYGNPETTTGGRALKFYASVRLDIRRGDTLKSGKDNIGNHVKVKVVKNTVAPPFRTAEFDILYGLGINKAGEVLDRAVDLGYIEKSGAWYAYEGEKIGQGRDNACLYVREHPELLSALEAKIKEHADAPVEAPDELEDDVLDIRALGLDDL
ncbi:MAG: DNA recombination/repair protein RecA, partial [Clostridia bacterium]|nr:DNA recombination/repair protein RecA [Clostridia bacterium]